MACVKGKWQLNNEKQNITLTERQTGLLQIHTQKTCSVSLHNTKLTISIIEQQKHLL